MEIPPPNRFIPFLNRLLCPKWMILYVFLFGLLVRLPVGFWFTNAYGSDYAAIARNLARGAGYSLGNGQPTAWRTPGYTLILAGLMALFGEQRAPLIILTSIVGAINASLCSWLGLKIFRRAVGLTAGILYVLIPYLAQKESATEGGFVTLGLLEGLCLLWKGWSNKRLIWIGLSGLIFAFSYLVRPTIGLIPIFVSISLLAGIPKDKKPLWHIASATILILAFLIGITPWAVRNKKVFGRWYFGQTIFWYTLYHTNHPRSFDIYPYYSLDNFMPMFPFANFPRHANEFERELWFRQQALTEIRKFHLKEILNRGCRKFLYLWSVRMVPYTNRIGNDPLTGQTLDTKRGMSKNLTFSIPYLFLAGFALLGSWQERKRRWLLFFAAGLLFSFSIPYIITVAYSRYTTQVYFVLILLAARGLVSIKGRD